MSWHDDRDEAENIAATFGINPTDLNNARQEAGWSWAETLHQLEKQWDAYLAKSNGWEIPDLDPHGNLPDLFHFYNPGA